MGRSSATARCSFERLLPGPVDRVWQYLTDSQLRGTWLATGAMEARVGGAVTLWFHHQDLTDHDEPTPAKFKAMENGHHDGGPRHALGTTASSGLHVGCRFGSVVSISNP